MTDEKILDLLSQINSKLEKLAEDVSYNREEIDALQRSVNSLNMLSSDTNNKVREAISTIKEKK
ncbi:MAG: hypothetical protein N4A40_04660 [Tissierellales bacterium]|jgi:prefoldin subunit 5|nr:hypothetical protein [Tissierellales bacterium]